MATVGVKGLFYIAFSSDRRVALYDDRCIVSPVHSAANMELPMVVAYRQHTADNRQRCAFGRWLRERPIVRQRAVTDGANPLIARIMTL